MAKKNSKFFYCDGCMGIFAINTGFTAPKNKYKLKVVCKSCYKQYIGKNPPLPAGAAPALKNLFGGFLNASSSGTFSTTNAGILSGNGGGLLGKANQGIVAAGAGNLKNANQGIVAAGAGNLVGHDGSSILSGNGGGFRRG